QIVASRSDVFLPKLNHRVRTAARSRIRQTHRLHRTESQSVTSAARDFFYWQASFEITRVVLLDMRGGALRGEHSIYKSLVLSAIERTVHVIVRAVERFSITRRAERNRVVNRFRVYDRADTVVEK